MCVGTLLIRYVGTLLIRCVGTLLILGLLPTNSDKGSCDFQIVYWYTKKISDTR